MQRKGRSGGAEPRHVVVRARSEPIIRCGSPRQCLLPRHQRRARRRASFARPVQVLQCNQCGGDPRALTLLRIVGREADLDRRVVYGDPRLDVLDERLKTQSTSEHDTHQKREIAYIDVYTLRGWARTRNLDWLSVRADHCAITVSSTSRVNTRVESQRWGKTLNRGSI